MDLRLALMAGTDIPVPECQIILHQPKIREIALIGEDTFFTGIQCLTINKNMMIEDETLLTNINNFQIFMKIMTEKEAVDQKQAVIDLCQLILPTAKVAFTPRTMIITLDDVMLNIDDNNFEFFQEALKDIFCVKAGVGDQTTFNPANAKAREIAQKLMRGRQRVAAQKQGEHASIFSQYVSTLTVGLGSMSLQNCLDLTMYQLFDLVERYSLYINWDIDIKSRLAGANPDEHPDNWMKNIHS